MSQIRRTAIFVCECVANVGSPRTRRRSAVTTSLLLRRCFRDLFLLKRLSKSSLNDFGQTSDIRRKNTQHTLLLYLDTSFIRYTFKANNRSCGGADDGERSPGPWYTGKPPPLLEIRRREISR